MRKWSSAVCLALVYAVGLAPLSGRSAQTDADPEATISALQTQVADLTAGEPTAEPAAGNTVSASATATRPAAETEDGRDGRSTREVNVELVLDVSGSMVQALDTGETRMEAAKRSLAGVIAAIPEREGINVGLRIYGHEGNNTEAGRAESCRSSELVVPLDGVAKDDLEAEIERLQPTGWTPIGLSLERAAEDLPRASDDVVNAVVLVTDGLETCGGDPVDAAADLRGGNRAAATHVIGFALTPEEQEVIGAIAREGDGLLFGAGNADELSQALFSVLEELEIVTGTGFIGGNAFPLIPAGESGEISVVASGTLDRIGSIPFVVRNNTSDDVSSVKVTVTARDASGELAGVADALLVQPTFVPAGGLAFGYGFFGNVSLPPDVTFEFDVTAPLASEDRFTVFRDLDMVEASLFEDRIVGVVENGHDQELGNLGFGAICFDLEGNPVSHNQGFVNTTIAPGETQEFQVTIPSYALDAGGCPAFLITGRGF